MPSLKRSEMKLHALYEVGDQVVLQKPCEEFYKFLGSRGKVDRTHKLQDIYISVDWGNTTLCSLMERWELCPS